MFWAVTPKKKLIALGFPPPAADLADPIVDEALSTAPSISDARPSTVVVEIEPTPTDANALPEKIEIVQKNVSIL